MPEIPHSSQVTNPRATGRNPLPPRTTFQFRQGALFILGTMETNHGRLIAPAIFLDFVLE